MSAQVDKALFKVRSPDLQQNTVSFLDYVLKDGEIDNYIFPSVKLLQEDIDNILGVSNEINDI